MATITHVREIKPKVTPLFAGSVQELINKEIDSESKMNFVLACFPPGESNPRNIHPNCEEIIFILSGECDHTLGDETFHLEPGMLLRIPRNVPHNAITTSYEPCRMIVVYDVPDHQTMLEK